MIGPVVKISEADLPQRPTFIIWGTFLHDLPRYLGGWQSYHSVCKNEATRYISPTKTPEYLAAGLPVVSTPIHDVVDPYEKLGLVLIADNAEDFAAAIDDAGKTNLADHRERASVYLSTNSWDETFAKMSEMLSVIAASPLAKAAGELGQN